MMKHNLDVTKTGYGHWKILTTHYNKEINCITTNSSAVDDYRADDSDKQGRVLVRLRGYNSLRNECIRKNRL